MLAPPMTSPVTQAVLQIAAESEPNGVTMGTVVDTLEGEGHSVDLIERTLWDLLAQRRLTPCGYVCRKVRRRDPMGEPVRARSYELLFIPWSEELDRQLDLQLAHVEEG